MSSSSLVHASQSLPSTYTSSSLDQCFELKTANYNGVWQFYMNMLPGSVAPAADQLGTTVTTLIHTLPRATCGPSSANVLVHTLATLRHA
jgi:hypothetical protein